MASFNQDFTKIKNGQGYLNAINDFINGKERKAMLVAEDYYNGENTTVNALKRIYWSDTAKGWAENPFVANNKIGYGFFYDMVSQKVNTLHNEPPSITTNKYEFPNKYMKQLGFSLKKAGTIASIQGTAFLFEDLYNNITVFKASDCIPYYDDETGVLRALIRFWTVKTKAKDILYFEVYEEDGVTKYKDTPRIEIVNEKTPYKFTIRKSAISTIIQNDTISKLPIVEYMNNEERKSDFRKNIRSKIDIIDIVESGFANNIEDFSDVYWTIRESANIPIDTYEDFVANINRTKKVFGEDVQPHQIEIPTQARSTFVEMIKKDLIKDSGVIDTETMTGSSLTTTAIKAATMELRQRVSDFEWFAYQTTNDLIAIYQNYNMVSFEFDVVFEKMLINNDTELIDNVIKIGNDISEYDRFTIYKRANIIDNVDKAIERKQGESVFRIEEPAEEITEEV